MLIWDHMAIRSTRVRAYIACGDSWHYSIHFSDHTDRANSPQVKDFFLSTSDEQTFWENLEEIKKL